MPNTSKEHECGGHAFTSETCHVDGSEGKEPGFLVKTSMRFPDGTLVQLTKPLPRGTDNSRILDEQSLQAARLHTMVVYWDRFG